VQAKELRERRQANLNRPTTDDSAADDPAADQLPTPPADAAPSPDRTPDYFDDLKQKANRLKSPNESESRPPAEPQD